MADKWIEMLGQKLEQGDKLLNGYFAEHEGAKGWLALSQNRLFFIEESGGFLGKKYNLILDMPYAKIDKIATEGNLKITVSEIGGRSHTFESSGDIPAIEKKLKQLTVKKT
ncbi:MAG: hypothetical protein V1857_03795 [archaeon]